jgi:lipoprotein-anchoring transpeptidase ErfK/SrfK
VTVSTTSKGDTEMRNIFRFIIVAVALAALPFAASALVAPSEAAPVASPTVAPASPPPTQVYAEHEHNYRPGAIAARNPDPLHRTGDLIEVSIAKQRLTAWHDGHVVYRFKISTGRPGYETPTGHYEVIVKIKNAWSRKWSVWMPWAMNWHGNYFIHQLPHKDGSSVNIGASRLGHPDSHGCVRVGVRNAEALYHWASVGTPVWVH